MLGEFRASGYATFLARPVRGETLLRVLLDQPCPGAGPSRSRREAAHQPPRRRQTPAAGLSMLVAEDNDINAMLARATLLKAGHRVKVVGNGKAAVEAVTGAGRKHRYDVVLMDLHMPVMDGLDAIAAIRRYEEENGRAAGADHGAVGRQPGEDAARRAGAWRQRLRHQAARSRRAGARRRGAGGRRLMHVAQWPRF